MKPGGPFVQVGGSLRREARSPRSCAEPASAAESGLLRWLSLVLIVCFLLGVLTPVLGSIGGSFTRLSVPLPLHVPAEPTETPYGICADLCTSDGACRHIVVPGGWHRGDHVPDALILDAPACR